VLESVDLVVPHQANKTMVLQLAQQAGLSPDRIYFNIATVGNASSASIPLAIHDAVRDGVISSPMRIFTPGFGAGAVAGYTVMRLDPAAVAVQARRAPDQVPEPSAPPTVGAAPTSDDVNDAFR
jgi:3-hydroxy-3-methylglutaryl CoA synthase